MRNFGDVLGDGIDEYCQFFSAITTISDYNNALIACTVQAI